MSEKKRRDDDSTTTTCRVKVHIRLKKCIEKEGATYNIFADGSQLHIPNHEGRLELDRWYKFDHIYSAIASNKEVYRFSTYDLVESALKGINTAIFAYGQTGSGKTHTLMSKDGVTAHMVSHLFNRIWKSKEDYKVTCSYFQIYNEHIYDLLNPQNTSECVVREDSGGEVYAENVTNIDCVTPMDVYELINIGRKSLIIAETKMSRLSCRAHTVCQLAIERRKKLPQEKKRAMQETYLSSPDITVQEVHNNQEKKSRIDFTTVPFNKSEIRKRHSIAVTKINESKKSPRIPKRSPSVQHTRIPVGIHRERSNSMRSRNRRKSPSPSPSEPLAPIKSPRARRASGGSSTEEKSKEEQLSMDDSIGLDGVKKLHDLYQSNVNASDTDTESIPFESENSFTFSEGCSDDYDSYYHEENEDTTDESFSIDDKETNGHNIGSFSPETTVRRSKMSIVDLAGSERLTETNVDFERLKEAQNINLSLLELGNVVAALATGKKKHVPYRNSVLTRLLKDSLGGNCKTKFLLCISTRHVDANETKCTLEFGQKLTKIYTNPTLNIDVDYQRKYEQLLRQLQNNEDLHEKRKNELIQRISIEEEEIRKEEEKKCEHESILNSLEVKLDHVTSEHEEKARKISSLRETLLEQENQMKLKEEEILKLQYENEALFERIKSKSYSTETLSTLDAASFSSPDLTLDDDCCDGAILNSSVSNGYLNSHESPKGSSVTLEAFHIDDPLSPITNSNKTQNKTPNNELDSLIINKSQNVNSNNSIIVSNGNHNYNGLMENSDITSSMECNAESASYLSDDVTYGNTISINSPTLFKALSEAIKDIPHNELYETAARVNESPSELSTNDENASSGNIIEADVELHVDVPSEVNYSTDVDIEKRILVDTEVELNNNTANIDVVDYNNVNMTDVNNNNDDLVKDIVDVDQSDSKAISTGNDHVAANVKKSKAKIIDDVQIYKSPISATPLVTKSNGEVVETDYFGDVIVDDDALTNAMPLVPSVDAITDIDVTGAMNEQSTQNEIDIDTIDDILELPEEDKNENKNENDTSNDLKEVSEDSPVESNEDNIINSELKTDVEQTDCSKIEVNNNRSTESKANEVLPQNETFESEISDSMSTITEISVQNHKTPPAMDSSSDESLQEDNKKYDEMTIENVKRNNFEMQTSTLGGGVMPSFKRHSDIIDSRGSSSLDYLNSSSQDSFPFTDVSDGSTIETVDSITHTDDDYVIDLYTPTPIETCDIATNTSDDELSTDVLFAEQRSPNAVKRLSNPIVVTFVQSPKFNRKCATLGGRLGKGGRRTVNAGTNTPVWNWWSPLNAIKNKSADTAPTAESETNLLTSQFVNADTLRAAILVELTRIQRLVEQAKDPMEDLVTEFEMIGSIEGSRTSLNAEDTEPVINDVLYSVMNEVLNVVPNLITSNSNQSETKTDTAAARKQDFNNMRAPNAASTAANKTENQLDILKDYLEERKRLLQQEIRYVIDEANLNSVANNNNNNETKNEKNASRQPEKSDGSLSDIKLIESLIYHVASGRSPQLESASKYNDLLDTVLSLHTITSCLITISRWPRAIFDIKAQPTQSEQQQAGTELNGSPRDCASVGGLRKQQEEKQAKQRNRKSFLDKFLCMPTKSSKVKK